ncbi:hypothetical protein LTR70_004233 [Exophiala xenobiotica]|uniref:Zn(2)-C6 fungal-type domain-containing protein n=1 Tax=Lithohypha guttulata TaxID=1690604 RepID=A0ABR0KE98_9EURO|nr:hypothetical protein LTR24_003715 [Lithohypha guttulata]KAK5321520.1 hypothetical protein LTR70_004233 [Exophiala xenobiotica]
MPAANHRTMFVAAPAVAAAKPAKPSADKPSSPASLSEPNSPRAHYLGDFIKEPRRKPTTKPATTQPAAPKPAAAQPAIKPVGEPRATLGAAVPSGLPAFKPLKVGGTRATPTFVAPSGASKRPTANNEGGSGRAVSPASRGTGNTGAQAAKPVAKASPPLAILMGGGAPPRARLAPRTTGSNKATQLGRGATSNISKGIVPRRALTPLDSNVRLGLSYEQKLSIEPSKRAASQSPDRDPGQDTRKLLRTDIAENEVLRASVETPWDPSTSRFSPLAGLDEKDEQRITGRSVRPAKTFTSTPARSEGGTNSLKRPSSSTQGEGKRTVSPSPTRPKPKGRSKRRNSPSPDGPRKRVLRPRSSAVEDAGVSEDPCGDDLVVDDEEFLDLDDLDEEDRKVAEAFLDEGGKAGSKFNSRFLADAIDGIHSRLPKQRHLSLKQRRTTARLRKILQAIFTSQRNHPKAVSLVFKRFMDFVNVEDRVSKVIDICLLLVLLSTLEAFGGEQYSAPALIEIIEQLGTDPKATDADRLSTIVRQYVGETRTGVRRWEDHEQMLQKAKFGSWYYEAAKLDVQVRLVLADISQCFKAMGFYYVFFIRLLEAAFCVLLRTLPAKAVDERVKELKPWIRYSAEELAFVKDIEEKFQSDTFGSGLEDFTVPMYRDTLQGHGFNTNWPLGQGAAGLNWHREEDAILADVYDRAIDITDTSLRFSKADCMKEMSKLLNEWRQKRTDADIRVERTMLAIACHLKKKGLLFKSQSIFILGVQNASNESGSQAEGLVKCFTCWSRREECDNAEPKCSTCVKDKRNCRVTKITETRYDEIAPNVRENLSLAFHGGRFGHKSAPEGTKKCYTCWERNVEECDNAQPFCNACTAGPRQYSKYKCILAGLSEDEYVAEVDRRNKGKEHGIMCYNCWSAQLIDCDNAEEGCNQCFRRGMTCTQQKLTRAEVDQAEIDKTTNGRKYKLVDGKQEEIRCYGCWRNYAKCDNAPDKCHSCTNQRRSCRYYEMTKAEFDVKFAELGDTMKPTNTAQKARKEDRAKLPVVAETKCLSCWQRNKKCDKKQLSVRGTP